MNISEKLFLGGRNHLDLYVNYKCNLKCAHCFVGDNLSSKIEFELESAIKLLEHSRNSGAKSLSLLGGEPTLYKHIERIIEVANEIEYSEIKLVTNGMKPLQKIVKVNRFSNKPIIVFSLDSIDKVSFESIRGKGTFKTILESITLSLENGYSCAAIISVSNMNYDTVIETIVMLDKLNFKYINIHHVNELGFATKTSIVPIKKWLLLKSNVEDILDDIKIQIRFEEKYKLIDDLDDEKCVLRENLSGNVMVFPDGRIYRCALFYDNDEHNSLNWNGSEIVNSNNKTTEVTICNESSCKGCPRSSQIIPDENDYVMTCMYSKTVYN